MKRLNRICRQKRAIVLRRLPEPIGNGDDVLIEKQLTLLWKWDRLSTSSLQRKLKLGYARAARIIDELESMGVVGPYEGAKPRKVIMSKQQWANAVARKKYAGIRKYNMNGFLPISRSDMEERGIKQFDFVYITGGRICGPP